MNRRSAKQEGIAKAHDAQGQDSLRLLVGLRRVYAHMTAARRRQLSLLLVLMLIGGFAELATIGAVVPFLSLLGNPDAGAKAGWIRTHLGFGLNPVIGAALLFSAVAVFAGIIRLWLTWSTQDFAYRLGHELTVEIQRRALLQPYGFYITHNSSKLLAALVKVEILVFEVLLPSMQALIAVSLASFIMATLLYIDPFIALLAAAAFSLVYLLAAYATGNRLTVNSQLIAKSYDERMQIAKESFDGIRDVIIDNSQRVCIALFERVNLRLNLARANTAFIASAPRFVIESAGMVLIAGIAAASAQFSGGFGRALPVLGATALGAQRLLPLLQTIYAGCSTARGQRTIFGEVVNALELPYKDTPVAPEAPPLPLDRAISLDRVSYTYPGRVTRAVDAVTLEIPAASWLGIVGKSGSGKSTLVDLILGILQPDQGSVLIDDVPVASGSERLWHRSIAHVPQSIFLADTTIAGNIALSLPDGPPDRHRIVESAKKAQLHDFVVSLPDGYETQVGEHGVRLSGGQRQRLGIARAIYKDAPILMLDEATSALDHVTEREVIDALGELREQGRTIIIVSHRISTVRHCDSIARLDRGRLIGFGDASELLGADESVS